jgi:hypothetical protein
MPADGRFGTMAAPRGGGERVMPRSDRSPCATAENNIDTAKGAFPPWLQLPGGDGDQFHVVKGKEGVLLRMAYGGQAINDTTSHLSGRPVAP